MKSLSPPGILIDKFSDLDIRAWEKLSEKSNQYHIGLFYHLEGLRSLHHENLSKALNDSEPAQPLTESGWCRIINLKYTNEPLSSKGSLRVGGRFNIGKNLELNGRQPFIPFPVLYIAENYDTAYRERFSAPRIPENAGAFSGQEFSLVRPSSFTSLNINLKLNRVFDLTKASNLKAYAKIISSFNLTSELKSLAKEIGITKKILVRDAKGLKQALLDPGWKHYPEQYGIPANSQVFGYALKGAGFSGVLYPSTKTITTKCMAVFTDNLYDTDFVALADEAQPGATHTRIDSENR